MTIQQAIDRFPKQIESALVAVGKEAIRLSNDYAPVFRGDLRNSGRVELAENAKGHPTIYLVWGGQGKHGIIDYAHKQYFENLRHYFLSGKPVSILDNFKRQKNKTTGKKISGSGKVNDYWRAHANAVRQGKLEKRGGLRWVEKALATGRAKTLIRNTFIHQFGL